MRHAITRLEEELRVLRDVRRDLFRDYGFDACLTPGDEQADLAQVDLEIRQTRAALRLLRQHVPADLYADPFILPPSSEEKHLAHVIG